MHSEKRTFSGVMMSVITTVGIIWGDIGTSPLYTVSAIYNCEHECEIPDRDDLVGTLSCIIWALTIIAFLKYIIIVLQFDYHGEGGIFALYLNLTRAAKRRMSPRLKTLLMVLSVIGSSALIADSILTPALSILSAIEGIRDSRSLDASEKDVVGKLVVPITIVLLLLLFSIQRFGSTKVGVWFGPIMLVYFGSIAGVGIYNLSSANEWGVFRAFSPWYAIEYFVSGRFSGYNAFRRLSSILLCVTGAEAVYSDVGHTGKLPIYISWVCLVYPALILNYAGQVAYLMTHTGDIASAYWLSTPEPFYIPMLIISTMATLIASQALISGCFTLISSATALNLFLKVKVINTDPNMRGQIYIPEINLFMCIGTIILVAAFQKSVALAGAYGISVVLTFNITDLLLAAALYYVKWPKQPFIVPILAVLPFFVIDGFIFASTVVFKFVAGGWVTITLTFLMTFIMICWSYGRNAKREARKKADAIDSSTVGSVLQAVHSGSIRRGNGIGIYLSPNRHEFGKRVILSSSIQVSRAGEVVLTREDTPPVIVDQHLSGMTELAAGVPGEDQTLPPALSLYLKVTGVIQRIVVLLHVDFNRDKPVLNINERVTIEEISTEGSIGMYSVTVSFGFAEPLSEVDMGKIVRQWILEQIPRHVALTDLFAPTSTNRDDQVWYFVHSEDIKPTTVSNFFRRWYIWLYSVLHHLSRTAYVFLNLPPNEVVQMGDIVFI